GDYRRVIFNCTPRRTGVGCAHLYAWTTGYTSLGIILNERKPMRPVQILTISLTLVLGSVAAAFGQSVSATTGALNGKVTDRTAAVLPGVTVTISSPAMQGVRTATTSEDGTYRFPAVPPGDYKITYELTGFSTIVREGIRVGLGFTATVNAEMVLASMSESVTVTGESPVVDVTSTKTSRTFNRRRWRRCRTARASGR